MNRLSKHRIFNAITDFEMKNHYLYVRAEERTDFWQICPHWHNFIELLTHLDRHFDINIDEGEMDMRDFNTVGDFAQWLIKETDAQH